MRKNKTWEITLTDNIRLVANEPIENAVVYTTDTEAYLNFRVIDSGFEFDSATIAMLNKDDGSIVERAMTKEDDTAVYEIESDIVPHFGLWQAQVLFKQGEEIFTSTPVTFVIERYMMADQPPRLEDVTNWKDLYENATETINELNRINDDLNATKQNVEQAEVQRVLAEQDRESAEAQRKIDHANRSAEFDGKADKVVLKNLIENGDFSNGLIGWNRVGNPSNFSVIDNELRIIGAPPSTSGIMQDIKGSSDDKFYFRIHKYEDLNNVAIRVFNYGTYTEGEYLYFGETSSHIVLKKDGIRFYLQTLSSGPENINATIDEVCIVNLTQIFGAGNEPTKEEMDELIKATGYIDGEYVLNNKEMLGHLMKGISEKANKKQEDWTTPTLLNGWVRESTGLEPQYMKDEFGFVHLKGCVKGGTSPLIFSLPLKYRTLVSRRFPVTSGDSTIQNVTVNGGAVEIRGNSGAYTYLDNVTFEAEV